jgi:hypothetical protein
MLCSCLSLYNSAVFLFHVSNTRTNMAFFLVFFVLGAFICIGMCVFSLVISVMCMFYYRLLSEMVWIFSIYVLLGCFDTGYVCNLFIR